MTGTRISQRPRPGSVAVDQELIDFLDPQAIDDAVAHLRAGGGKCWHCNRRIEMADSVSLVAQTTSVGTRLGFFHIRCAPPQVINERSNRRAALRMDAQFHEMATEVQGFLVLRNFPNPKGVLVVSANSVMRTRESNDEFSSPWINFLLDQGLSLLGPDVMDAVPDFLTGWHLNVDANGTVDCGRRGLQFYSGELEVPSTWREAVTLEGECLLVVSAFGVNSDELGTVFEGALSAFAGRGLVVGATIAARAD